MGQELQARVTFRDAAGKRASDGKAMLETSEVIFRGDFRLRISFRDISRLETEDGRLTLGWPEGEATFEIGHYAAAWADKIRNPRGLLEKLGVKPGMRATAIGVEDQGFLAQLRERAAVESLDGGTGHDLVFFEADVVEDLARLPELRAIIADKGAIWVISPKGKGARIRDVDVIAAAKASGLVDTKVVGFSDTHTALKLVIPVALRSRAASPVMPRT